MKGKYLRMIRDGDQRRDPTMTHMRDPRAVKVGDILQDAYGYARVVRIDEACFGDPNTRFAHIVGLGAALSKPDAQAIAQGTCGYHDLRDEDRRTMLMNQPRAVAM